MRQAQVGHGRHTVQDEDVLDIVHNNPPTSTYQISSAIELSHTAVWHTVCENNQLYHLHVQSVQGLQPEEEI
jgi:hypothetical protein